MWDKEGNDQKLCEGLSLLLKGHSNDLKTIEIKANKGDLLLKQGEPTNDLFLLKKGSVSVVIRSNEGISHLLTRLDSETLIGEMALFGVNKVSADVIVCSHTAELLKINGSELLSAIMFDVEIATELLTLVCQRLQQSSEIIGLFMESINAIHSRNIELFDNATDKLSLKNDGFEILTKKLKDIYYNQNI